jgi:hypothetical protein
VETNCRWRFGHLPLQMHQPDAPRKMEPIHGTAPCKGGLQNLSEPSSTGKMVCPVLDSNQCALSINHDSVESRTVFHSAQDIEMVDARGVEPLSESRKA